MKKKNYMVAVTVTIPLTAYLELPAENAKQALKKAKQFFKNGIPDDWVRPLKLEADYSDDDIKLATPKLHVAGRASMFHSPEQCSACRELKRKTKKKRIKQCVN